MANGNWQSGEGGSGGAGEVMLDADYQALVATSGLTAGKTYYISDVPAMWLATDGNSVVGVAFVYGGTEYIGDEARAAQTEIDLEAGTWASRPLTGFTTGTLYYRRMTDVGTLSGGTVMSWLGGTSTEWHLVAPLRMRATGAGTTTTSAQYPTNTRFTLPAGLLQTCSAFEVQLKVNQTDETSVLATWRLKLGSVGDATDATIAAPNGTSQLGAGDNVRAYALTFHIASTTSFLIDSNSNSTSFGWSGTANTTGGGSSAAVSLGGSDDTGDALYLGLDYTMSTSNTAITTTLIVTLLP